MDRSLPSVIFMGTPEFAIPSLEALVGAQTQILLVVTQPDRARGRGRKVSPPPVKQLALEYGLPVYQPERIKDPEVAVRLRALAPECLVVAAYGQLLPPEILRIPTLAAVNVHASLLPKYRGPAPIPWALINGEKVTGVTTMLMEPGMDTGDILLSREVTIHPDDTAGTLHQRLAKVGAGLLVETLRGLMAGTIEPRVQDHSQATYAPMLAAEDGKVDWRREAERICRHIRGMEPWPGAFTYWRGRRLKLFGCRVLPGSGGKPPGTVVAVEPEGLQVAAGEGILLIESLQLEARRRLSVPDFVRGHFLPVGTVFGE